MHEPTVRVGDRLVVEVPRVPNYILLGGGEKLPVSHFDTAQLRKIGEAWTANLIANADRQASDNG